MPRCRVLDTSTATAGGYLIYEFVWSGELFFLVTDTLGREWEELSLVSEAELVAQLRQGAEFFPALEVAQGAWETGHPVRLDGDTLAEFEDLPAPPWEAATHWDRVLLARRDELAR